MVREPKTKLGEEQQALCRVIDRLRDDLDILFTAGYTESAESVLHAIRIVGSRLDAMAARPRP